MELSPAHMWTKMPIQLFAIALLASAASLSAQNRGGYPIPLRTVPPPAASMPATAPTTADAATQPTQPAGPPTPAQSPAKRATVTYTGGQLSVSASNSSLNQILREISRNTGIKITGGVAEERVFGDYGPAPASQVLASLLDGTASNMILVDGSGDRATELILTPRTGGASPPNPNSASFDSNNDDDSPRPSVGAPPPGSQSVPSSSSPVVGPLPPQNPDMPATSPNPPSTDSNGQSSGGAKTPQQIFDELMKMRRQQQQQPQ